MEESKKLTLSIKKPTDKDPEIFIWTYLGKLTRIVDYFESMSDQEVRYVLAEKDTKGNTPLDIASYLGFKNIVIYFLKYGADLTSVDMKQHNVFHFLCYKREYTTLMMIQNFIQNRIKEHLYQDLSSLKRTYGFKNIDVKHGKLIRSGYINQRTQNNFKDFISSVESLAINTYQDYIHFYRRLLTQQDSDGRNPLHFSTFEKLIIALLDFGIDKEAEFDHFSYECEQLKMLEDKSVKRLDPRMHKEELKEFKHLLDPKVYKKIYRDYGKQRKELIKEVLNTEDVNDQTPLHMVSKRGNYVLVRHFLSLGADPNKRDINQNNPLDIAKNKYVRQALTSLNEEAEHGNDSNITRLVDEGENINERMSILGEAPIHKAVLSSIQNKVKALRTVLEQDAQVDLIDNNGWTALHHAAHNGEYDC